MEIRKAEIADTEAVHRLSWQLGYSPEMAMVKSNIEAMLANRDYELVVAVLDTAVVGWMSLAQRMRIEDVSFLEVAALVTDEHVRGRGVGKLLMNYAERIAKKRNLTFVGLRSSTSRVEAHAFYMHIGYQKTKDSAFFRKDVP